MYFLHFFTRKKGLFISFLSLLFIFSCVHSLKEERKENGNPVCSSEKKELEEKEPLEFAIAGEAADWQANISNEEAPASLAPKRESTSGFTSKRNRTKVLEMLNTANRVNGRGAEAISSSFPVKTGEIEVPDRKEAGVAHALGEDFNYYQMSEYDQSIFELATGKQPILITIGQGKKYWMGLLVGKIFKPCSACFYQMLDWIVEHNAQFKCRQDLDVVNAGDVILMPTKNMILNDELAEK